jgi:hypothetical protein
MDTFDMYHLLKGDLLIAALEETDAQLHGALNRDTTSIMKQRYHDIE